MQEAGVEQPVLTVPMRYPNAVLTPALFAAFMRWPTAAGPRSPA